MLKYKIDVLQALKDRGISTYQIKKNHLFGQQTLTNLRKGEPVSWKALDALCELLDCEIGDLLTAHPEGESADHRQAALTFYPESKIKDL